MALIEKRRLASGKSAYRVRVKYLGRVMTSTHADRHSAERWAAEAGARIRDEAHFAGEANRRRVLADLLDRYATYVLPNKRNASNQKLHLAWWKQRIGKTPVEGVTRSLVSQCRDELGAPNKAGVVRAPATVVRYLASLSHVFSVAIGDWEWATINPVQGIRKPTEPRGRDRYLLEDEREKLLAACRASTSPDIYAVVMLALATGMRRGEIMTLEWADIDLQRQVVTLRQTKNGTRRTVPLCSPAYEIMVERNKVT
jgi:integrase